MRSLKCSVKAHLIVRLYKKALLGFPKLFSSDRGDLWLMIAHNSRKLSCFINWKTQLLYKLEPIGLVVTKKFSLKMWAKFRASKINRGGKKFSDAYKSLNVNEEYRCALRTKSFADFSNKAQSLVNEASSPSYCHHRFSEILLEPRQEAITAILESAILSRKSDLKALLLNYFDISAEASKICSHLLKSISHVQSNYSFIQQVIDSVDDYSPEQFGLIVSKLRSFIVLNSPFDILDKQDFEQMNDKYSSLLQNLKLKRKKVTRKIKLINCFKKASSICITATCGLVALTVMVLAAHTLAATLLGPAIFSLRVKLLNKKLLKFRFLRSRFLRKVGEQLDVAAKGTYILIRDFDTISRLVARLHDEIEHNKSMIQFCLDRRKDKFSLQVLKEFKKNDVGFKKQVEELEEHVYLCLLTINRARGLVIKELVNSCMKDLGH